jgi:predicted secreted protein
MVEILFVINDDMMKIFTLILLLISCQPKNKPQNANQMKVGEIKTIELTGIPTSGYLWEYELSSKGNVEIKSELVTNDKLLGGKATEIFKIKALKKGTINIVFNLRRPWEKDIKPLETKQYSFEIVE